MTVASLPTNAPRLCPRLRQSAMRAGPEGHMGGVRWAQGRIASSAAPIRSTPLSSWRRPTICRLVGSPDLVTPDGTASAGH